MQNSPETVSPWAQIWLPTLLLFLVCRDKSKVKVGEIRCLSACLWISDLDRKRHRQRSFVWPTCRSWLLSLFGLLVVRFLARLLSSSLSYLLADFPGYKLGEQFRKHTLTNTKTLFSFDDAQLLVVGSNAFKWLSCPAKLCHRVKNLKA